jgi:tannase/feruloyl esterase
LSSRRRTLPIVFEELSGMSERPMIMSMPTTVRPQHRYGHRLRNLVQRSRAAAPSDTAPVVLADAGVEIVTAPVDALIHTGVLRRLLAFTELKFSNSMIEKVAAIDQWVESGVRPPSILASHLTGGVADRTRPLCRYPATANYLGSGSTDDARNFHQAP